MSTTQVALGTVPQKILDIGTASLTTSFATLLQFDTHGANSIGFQMKYTKGGETNLSTSFEVLLQKTGEWVACPIIKTATQSLDAANASRAFEIFVGKEVSAMRIRAKITGTANGTTRLEVWGMLSAPTFPIIGSAY